MVNNSLIAKPFVDWKQLKSKSIQYLTDLVDIYGTKILHEFDPQSGYYPIHWAVLSGKSEMVDYIIRSGVSPRLKTHINGGPEPIHLAAIEGQIECINILLSHGIDINTKDNSGCTPLMRASTYGCNDKIKSSETILHLVVNGADLNKIDNTGLTCLHYAIAANNEEVVHLLLSLGLDANQMTGNRSRAIHFARQVGSEYLMRLLAPLTDDMDDHDLDLMLKKYKKVKVNDMLTQMLTLLARCVILMAIFSSLFWAYPQYLINYLPNSNQYFLNICLIFCNLTTWMSWYMTCTRDPGYLPKNDRQYKIIIDNKLALGQEMKTYGTRDVDEYCNTRLCHTCQTVQVLRSAHCRLCGRCTAGYDHHCIYLSTCIGLNNRVAFFVLNISLLLVGICGALLVYEVTQRDNSLFTLYHWFNFCYCLKFAIIGFIMTVCNARRAVINLTQNEEIKAWRCRYRHLCTKSGRFTNPYDKGYWMNIKEYFTNNSSKYSKVNSFDANV